MTALVARFGMAYAATARLIAAPTLDRGRAVSGLSAAAGLAAPGVPGR